MCIYLLLYIGFHVCVTLGRILLCYFFFNPQTLMVFLRENRVWQHYYLLYIGPLQWWNYNLLSSMNAQYVWV